MVTLHEAQADYISRWKKNSLQHFKDGDYDWIASLVEKARVKSIIEIGCGAGYSTLALASKGIQVFAIDPIPEAIETTMKLLKQFGISVGSYGEKESFEVNLKQIDAIENYEEVSKYLRRIDAVLICAPGGKLENNLTEKEKVMLRWGKYPDEQMKKESVFPLHKWAVIMAAARLAKENEKKLIVVDRGTVEELYSALNCVKTVTEMDGLAMTKRKIQVAPEDGVKLSDCCTELYLGAGLYQP